MQWADNCTQTNLRDPSLISYPCLTSNCPPAHTGGQNALEKEHTDNVLFQDDTLRKETVLHADLAGAEGTGAFLQQQVLYVVVPHQWLRETGGCAV